MVDRIGEYGSTQLGITRNLSQIMREMGERIARIATGKRISYSSEDPAGLAISERLEAQIAGLEQEVMGIQNLVSRAQTAEAGLGEITNVLQRMRTLAIQAASGTLTQEQKEMIQEEITRLQAKITFIAEGIEYHTQQLIQVVEPEELEELEPGEGVIYLTPEEAGLGEIDVVEDPEKALEAIDVAIGEVLERRAGAGATIQRYERRISALMTQHQRTLEAYTRIAGADIAREMMGLVKTQILQQAGLAMFAQGNLQTRNVLGLLQA